MSFARNSYYFISLYAEPCLTTYFDCIMPNLTIIALMSGGTVIVIPLVFEWLAYFIVWVLMSVLDILTFYHCRYSKENECAYISSQMMTVPELDGNNVDNFVYDELEVLRLRLEEKYDKKVELWTSLEIIVDFGSYNQFMLLFSFNPNV